MRTALVLLIAALALSTYASVPAVDHHQHLVSPAVATLLNGPVPPPAVAIPEDVARLLRLRAERWDDPKALEELYTDHAVALLDTTPTFGWVRGQAAVAAAVGSTYARPFTITPVSVQTGGAAGFVAAHLTRGEGRPTRRHFGILHLGIARGNDGVWRIASETFAVPRDTQEAYTADDLVKALDEAGIRRAVVLSGAFVFSSRLNPDAGTPAEHRAKARAENDWIAQEVAKYPDRLVAFCGLDPLAAYALEEMERCAQRKFRGIKLHFEESRVDLQDPEDVEQARRVFAAANRLGLAIVVHPQNNQSHGRANARLLFDRVLTAAPDVPIQIAHLWGGSSFSAEANETLGAYAEMVQANHPAAKHLLFDMAEAPLMALQTGEKSEKVLRIIATRIRQIGASRILFGSDGPAMLGHIAPREAWTQFRTRVPLTEEEFETIAKNVAPYLK